MNLLAHKDILQTDLKESEISDMAEGTVQGSISGGAIGGLAGLALGLTPLIIPGIGPVLVAGNLVTAIISALAGASLGVSIGGLLGAFSRSDTTEVTSYAEDIQRGNMLLIIQCEEEQVAKLQQAMTDAGAVRTELRTAEWPADSA
ncbi:MAG: hypothetical protein HC893_11660 [Chloroflexaceae bacterium]|nr:hypothetical protein [Chloroflexaceae bacterium]